MRLFLQYFPLELIKAQIKCSMLFCVPQRSYRKFFNSRVRRAGGTVTFIQVLFHCCSFREADFICENAQSAWQGEFGISCAHWHQQATAPPLGDSETSGTAAPISLKISQSRTPVAVPIRIAVIEDVRLFREFSVLLQSYFTMSKASGNVRFISNLYGLILQSREATLEVSNTQIVQVFRNFSKVTHLFSHDDAVWSLHSLRIARSSSLDHNRNHFGICLFKPQNKLINYLHQPGGVYRIKQEIIKGVKGSR